MVYMYELGEKVVFLLVGGFYHNSGEFRDTIGAIRDSLLAISVAPLILRGRENLMELRYGCIG